MALAITSFPVPVSPWIKTAESTGATLSTSAINARNFGLDPIKSKVVIASLPYECATCSAFSPTDTRPLTVGEQTPTVNAIHFYDFMLQSRLARQQGKAALGWERIGLTLDGCSYKFHQVVPPERFGKKTSCAVPDRFVSIRPRSLRANEHD